MKIQFTVNTDNIAAFADILNENELSNKIAGSTEEGQILIDVDYNKNNRDAIEELEDLTEAEND